jgi:hypothetical protein
MVTLNVGAGYDKRKFVVHKKLLCVKSEFFYKMFSCGFQEAAKGVVELPEDNPAAVSTLLDMLVYHNGIRTLAGKTDSRGETPTAWDPVEVYSLAQKWCFPANVLDDIMDQIIRYHFRNVELPSLSFINAAYHKTQDGSELRHYAMDCLSYALSHNQELGEVYWPSTQIEEMCATNRDFLRDYIASTRPGAYENATDPRRYFSEPCRYHAHILNDFKKCRHPLMTARDAGTYRRKETTSSPSPERASDDGWEQWGDS